MRARKSPPTAPTVKGAENITVNHKTPNLDHLRDNCQAGSDEREETRDSVAFPLGAAASLSKVKQLHKEPDLSPVMQDTETSRKWDVQEALAAAGITLDPNTGRMLRTLPDGSSQWIGGESRSELRTAFTLGENTAQFFREFRFEEVGFLTLSFPPDVTSPKEAGKRFDSLNSNWLRKFKLPWLRVCEPHKDKRPHYHMLIHLGQDIRIGFDFEAFKSCQAEYAKHRYSAEFNRLKKAYVSAASPFLVDLWGELRAQCKAARLGRSELLPIHKQGEAVSHYVGKYISKGSPHRVGEWKGARLVSYSNLSPRRASSRFSWLESGAEFRAWAAEVSESIGVTHDTVRDSCGSRWGWRLHQAKEAGLTAAQAGAFLLDSHALSGVRS